jgi:hypothetical protein
VACRVRTCIFIVWMAVARCYRGVFKGAPHMLRSIQALLLGPISLKQRIRRWSDAQKDLSHRPTSQAYTEVTTLCHSKISVNEVALLVSAEYRTQHGANSQPFHWLLGKLSSHAQTISRTWCPCCKFMTFHSSNIPAKLITDEAVATGHWPMPRLITEGGTRDDHKFWW